MKNYHILTILTLSLAGCQTDSGMVLPAPIAQTAMQIACNNKPADIIPNQPFTAPHFADLSGVGSAADAQSRFLEGFETIEYVVTQENIDRANALGANDPSIWGLKPLSQTLGRMAANLQEKGAPDCANFEAIVKTQGEPDAARFFTSTKYPPNPPRNWCIGQMAIPEQTGEFSYAKTQTSKNEGGGSLNILSETLTRSGAIVARRTKIWLSRPQFPIGVVNVNTDCDGRAINAPPPEFVGKEGIALRPTNAPVLVSTDP